MKNDDTSKQVDSFKVCTLCGHHWKTPVDMILDAELAVNGYQPSFKDSLEGHFLLTHNVEGCGTTIAIRAGNLLQFYDGPEHKVHMAYTERCNGLCQNCDDLSPCSVPCDMKWARDIIQVLKNHGPEEFLKELAESQELKRSISIAV